MQFKYVDIHKRNTNSLYYFKKEINNNNKFKNNLLRNLKHSRPLFVFSFCLIHAQIVCLELR